MIDRRKCALLALGSLCIIGAAAPAFAESAWDYSHARRYEVNRRIAHQEHRITEERREGLISHGQAQAMRAQLRGIRAEERYDASMHGGHISSYEQARLNGELNSTRWELGR